MVWPWVCLEPEALGESPLGFCLGFQADCLRGSQDSPPAKMFGAVGGTRQKTSHCLGRWMVVFAGDKGRTAVAQGATPAASQPDVRVLPREREGPGLPTLGATGVPTPRKV